jgi:hypothetical protein
LSLYRIKAADLADDCLDAKTLGQRVERYSAKSICDGISNDKDNNNYLGDLAENAIGVIKADRSYQRLAQSPELSWVSQSNPPYFLIEVKALAAGLPGR